MENDVIVEGSVEIHPNEKYVLISVNPRIYPMDIVLSAGYTFLEKCYVLVDGDPVEELVVELRPKDIATDLVKTAREFNNELVRYANHAIAIVKSAKLRESIIANVMKGKENVEFSTDAPWVEIDGKNPDRR